MSMAGPPPSVQGDAASTPRVPRAASEVRSDEQAVEFLHQWMSVGIDHLLPGGNAETKRQALLQARRTHMLRSAVEGTQDVEVTHATLARAGQLERHELEEREQITNMQAEAFMLIGADWTEQRCKRQRMENAARRRNYLREPLLHAAGVGAGHSQQVVVAGVGADASGGMGSPVHDHFMRTPRGGGAPAASPVPLAFASVASVGSENVLYGGMPRPVVGGTRRGADAQTAQIAAGSSSPNRAQERLQQHFGMYVHPPPSQHHTTPYYAYGSPPRQAGGHPPSPMAVPVQPAPAPQQQQQLPQQQQQQQQQPFLPQSQPTPRPASPTYYGQPRTPQRAARWQR